MTIEIVRPNEDGLGRRVWKFNVTEQRGHVLLILSSYEIERRKMPKGKFCNSTREDRWAIREERRYYSGLSRPSEIPSDVVDEARASIQVGVNIGGYSSVHQYDPPRALA